jgi:DNA repair exonuclease SbcCD nuclease subunit
MQRFRFVHTADLHIDSPFKGLAALNEVVAERLREATYQAFRNVVSLCKEVQADFLLVSGDVYDGVDRSPRAQLRFHRGLTELAEEGIESFVAHGNHDPLSSRFLSISWPDAVHVFGEEPSWAIAARDGEPLADIQGISFPESSVTENLALRFSSPRTEDLFNIGVLHCNVGGIEGHDNYSPCTLDDLKKVGMDYWALGHIHARQTVLDGTPTVAYPGATQGRDPSEAEPHGCLVVDVGPDRSITMQFRPLDVVRWECREVDVDGVVGIDALYERIVETLENARAEAQGRDVICRLTLIGHSPLYGELARGSAVDSLVEELRAGFEADSPWVWVERLSNRTRPEVDLEARAKQDDFLGALLRRAQGADPTGFQEVLSEVFSGRRDRLPYPDENEIRQWIEEAQIHLADLLEPEG